MMMAITEDVVSPVVVERRSGGALDEVSATHTDGGMQCSVNKRWRRARVLLALPHAEIHLRVAWVVSVLLEPRLLVLEGLRLRDLSYEAEEHWSGRGGQVAAAARPETVHSSLVNTRPSASPLLALRLQLRLLTNTTTAIPALPS